MYSRVQYIYVGLNYKHFLRLCCLRLETGAARKTLDQLDPDLDRGAKTTRKEVLLTPR
jgi:hypothetical protein